MYYVYKRKKNERNNDKKGRNGADPITPMEFAIKRAKSLDRFDNPSTTIYRLLEMLQGKALGAI